MRKIKCEIIAILCLLASGFSPPSISAPSPLLSFKADYFHHKIRFKCEVPASSTPAPDLAAAVEQNRKELLSCRPALQAASQRLGLSGYAEILWLERFSASLPRDKEEGSFPLTTFAAAVHTGRPLSRLDHLALLYTLAAEAGYTVGMMQADDYYFLILETSEEISGQRWGKARLLYTWEPGQPLSVPAGARQAKTAAPVLFHAGQAVEFIFPSLSWPPASKGEKRDFHSPPGCPESWSRPLFPRPGLEEYLALWPRDRGVQAANAHRILAAAGMAEILSGGGEGLSEEELGNCLLQYQILNLPYQEPSPEGRPRVGMRLPSETLFRGGGCDELSFTLLGLLRLAGFAPEQIVLLRWREGLAEPHMNLGVAPSSGRLSSGSFVEYAGRRFYVMDPAYKYLYNGRLATRWGLAPESCRGRRPELYPVK